MSTSVFTNGMWAPLQPAISSVASDGPALAFAAELSPLLLKIVGDHDEHPEWPAEQDARHDVPELEQPEPAVLEPADAADLRGAPPQRLVREVQPVRGDDHDERHADDPEPGGREDG